MRDLTIRIAVWAGVGFFVSLGWGLYFATRDKGIPIEPAAYVLTRLTQPPAAILLYLRPDLALSLKWVVTANAAAYAVLGLIVQMIVQHQRFHIFCTRCFGLIFPLQIQFQRFLRTLAIGLLV